MRVMCLGKDFDDLPPAFKQVPCPPPLVFFHLKKRDDCKKAAIMELQFLLPKLQTRLINDINQVPEWFCVKKRSKIGEF